MIFILSNQPADESTRLSDGLIEKTIGNIYKLTHKNCTEEKLTEIKRKNAHIVRKTAHFTIYLILGLLVTTLLKEYNLNNRKIIIYSILICMIYAISDEIHQTFVIGRSGELKDIIIDTCGSTVGIILTIKTIKNNFKTLKNKKISV